MKVLRDPIRLLREIQQMLKKALQWYNGLLKQKVTSEPLKESSKEPPRIKVMEYWQHLCSRYPQLSGAVVYAGLALAFLMILLALTPIDWKQERTAT